ncbi:MAG: glycosyltransferase [Clostridiales Family XIII bacterium]|jgi:glycosyltransferase involved in cell wall biosynthesis|nr:glycosyltransferase [Clostridiales Family XIII bacterium]
MENETTKISIIIPVYNAARYIEECVLSAAGQPLREIEIICVDDGSSDSSMDIVESLRERDGRIKAVYKPHSGPGATRNTGLAGATGKYVLFLDADDMLADGSLEELFQTAESLETDILYFGGESIYNSPELEESFPQYKDLYKRKVGTTEAMAGLALYIRMQEVADFKSACVLQMYRRGFLSESGLSFLEGVLHEDPPFTFISMIRARRAAVTDATVYVRRVREGSIMTVAPTFDNLYGYYAALREMLFELRTDGIAGADRLTRDILHKAINRMHKLALRVYAAIDGDTLEAGLAVLDAYDRSLFDLTIRPAARAKRLRARNLDLEEKKAAMKAKLEAEREKRRAAEGELRHIKRSFVYRAAKALRLIKL